MGNTDTHFQQQLSRSYSLEFPNPPSDDVTPRMRYSLNQAANRRHVMATKPSRYSLNHARMNDSQVSLRNRQVCRFNMFFQPLIDYI